MNLDLIGTTIHNARETIRLCNDMILDITSENAMRHNSGQTPEHIARYVAYRNAAKEFLKQHDDAPNMRKDRA